MTAFSGTKRPETEATDVDVDGAVRRSLALHPIDALVAVTLIGLGVWWFHLTDGAWFFADEYPLALRGRTPQDLLEPYNGHLSITYLAVYRLHFGLFGFSHYTLLRVAGIIALLSVPAALYVTTRSRVGPAVAGFVALLVALTTSPSLEPGGMNHNAAITFGLVAAWAMTRPGRRFDLIVAGALALSFATAGDALPFAVALLALCAVTRASRRRWVAVATPVALWVLWRFVFGVESQIAEVARVGLVDQVLLPFKSIPSTLRGLAFGSSIAATVLAIVLVGALVRKVRTEGRTGMGTIAAWGLAWWFWWFGLAMSRGLLADTGVFRYRFAASVLLLLAVLPQRTAEDDPLVGRLGPPRARWLQTGVLVLMVVGLVIANRDTTRSSTKSLASFGKKAREDFLVFTALPSVVPPDHVHSLLFGSIDQEQLLDGVRAYGPPPLQPEQIDDRLVGQGAIAVSGPTEVDDGTACSPSPGRLVTTGEPITLRTTDQPAEVRARLFGDEDVLLVEIPPDSSVTIDPPEAFLDHLWVLTTEPVCVGS